MDWSDMIDDYMPNLLSWTDEFRFIKYITELTARSILSPGT